MAVRTFIRPEQGIQKTNGYNDQLPAGIGLTTDAVTLVDDINALRSQTNRILGTGNFYDELPEIINGYGETTSPRSLSSANQQLYTLERKRVLVANDVWYSSVTVPAGQNFVVLSEEQLPGGDARWPAVGDTAEIGAVCAYLSLFGTYSNGAVVSGSNSANPKNLCEIRDASTHDPILYNNDIVYGLAQCEQETSGDMNNTQTWFSGSFPRRLQLSFVAGYGLTVVPASFMEGKQFYYSIPQRVTLEQLNEQAFLRGAVTDVPATLTQTLQQAYDNQGFDPVTLTQHASLTLGTTGLPKQWRVYDEDNDPNTPMFWLSSDSGTDNTFVNIGSTVDQFTVEAANNTFMQSVRVSSNQPSELYLGYDTATSTSRITSSGQDVPFGLYSNGEMVFSDKPSQTATNLTGIQLSSQTADWNEFYTTFSLASTNLSLVKSLTRAYNRRQDKVALRVTTAVPAMTDVKGGVNLEAAIFGGASELPDMWQGYDLMKYFTSYDVYVNGNLMVGAPESGYSDPLNPGDLDYYAGTPEANTLKALKFAFPLQENDIIMVIPHTP